MKWNGSPFWRQPAGYFDWGRITNKERYMKIYEKEKVPSYQITNQDTGFPRRRLRRLRRNENFRRMVREASVSVNDLVMPLFVVHGEGVRQEIGAIPGNYHLSVDSLVEEAKQLQKLGIPAILLFGLPGIKDEDASEAYSPDGIIQTAVRAVKKEVPDILVITD